MPSTRQWCLGVKLSLIGIPSLLLGLMFIAATLWVSWQLDGGAAAVNEAGRLRMQAYRLALSIGTGGGASLPAQRADFERSIRLLRDGDPDRPLLVPWDDKVSEAFATLERDWAAVQQSWFRAPPPSADELRNDSALFAEHIDALVAAIEMHMSKGTALLHMLQVAMMVLAVLGSAGLLYIGYRFVLEPVGHLKAVTERIQMGDLGARVERISSDEFGTLANGFNSMAAHLQSMYKTLEARVADKTFELGEKRDRLEALYAVTTLTSKATTLDELATGFTDHMKRVARADGVALRWSDESNQRFHMLASAGLPVGMTDEEQCIKAGDCFCGSPAPLRGIRVVAIPAREPGGMHHCSDAGFETIVSIPILHHDRLMGEVDLFYHNEFELSLAERSLLEALTAHLAGAMENLRLNALEKEAAVSQERTFLAGELHDSIAQSLAFIKIQVHMMRDALAAKDRAQIERTLDEIDVGVRESYGDVRELLMHFRTRANEEDIEPALQTTLRKFELQSGLNATMAITGQGMPLDPDLQVQVLHILQEALSNVRKHSQAAHVWLDVQQEPRWRFEVRDDGQGFEHALEQPDESHVGLRIMSERAARIGASVEVISSRGRGTSVVLTLPSSQKSSRAPAGDAKAPALQ